MKTQSKAFYGYMLLIHLLLALVLWKSDFIEKVAVKLGISNSYDVSFYKQMTTVHRIMDGSVPEDAVIFIGDSITQALATSAIKAASANYGIYSDTTLGVLNRLPLYNSIERSKAVVLAIGVNDIHQQVSRSDTLSNYNYILESIPADVSVIVSSILPIGPVAQTDTFTNADIDLLNEQIEALANEHTNAVYLDHTDVFKDDAGYLHAAMHIGDGVHLSDEGYRVFIDNIANRLLTSTKER